MVEKHLLIVDEVDLAHIFAAFTRCEFGPDSYSDVQKAWRKCSKSVREGYVKEARKHLAAFAEDHDNRIAKRQRTRATRLREEKRRESAQRKGGG